MTNRTQLPSPSRRPRRWLWLLTVGVAGAVATGLFSLQIETPALSPLSGAAAASDSGSRMGPSGLPLPRFVSLRADRVNVRAGPTRDHRVTWTFAKAGLPIEVIAEYDNWRRIRDSDGAEGWVFHSLLSGRRTGVVAPWSRDETLAVRQRASTGAELVAYVEPGVLVDLRSCDGTWCEISVEAVRGWMEQELLWGVYPREVVR